MKNEQVLVTVNNPDIHFSKSNYFKFNLKQDVLWQNHIIQNSSFVDRWLAEQDSSILQLIPYIVMFSEDGLVFHYQRKGGGEQRLEGQWSIGLGGHINDVDIAKDEKINWDIVLRGAARELQEETTIEYDYALKNLLFLGSVYTPHDNKKNDTAMPSVGEVHLGIVYSIRVPIETKSKEEESLINGGFISLEDSDKDYEEWSKLIIDELSKIEKI